MKYLSMCAFCISVIAADPIDITKLPFSEEVNLVAVDVQVNPTNMPDDMLWEPPILLLYKMVDSLDDVRADTIRAELKSEFQNGTYQPVVIRTRQNNSLKIHFKNLIGMGEAPVRLVQGRVCKSCKEMKAYTFGYGPNQTDQTMYPYLASVHAHGVAYSIENDGTNAGFNPVDNPAANGLVEPGGTRTYYYKNLDFPGVWPLHDHAFTSHSVSRGLHLALVVESGKEYPAPDHDFLIMFSDYPDFDAYEEEFYFNTFVPPFLHMKNAFVMHAHALNGFAAMLMPRMRAAMMNGGTRWDAMRSDIVRDPVTPVFETELGDLVRFRLLSFGSATTHSFHIHGHVWFDHQQNKYLDNIPVAAGSSYELAFYAGGPPFEAKNYYLKGKGPVRSGVGDWLYHCHIVPHVKHGMWGIFRVKPPAKSEAKEPEEPTP